MNSTKIKYPVYEPLLNGNEKKYVLECLDTTWISSKGKFITEFETQFARYLNVKFAASASNGTTALHIALLALGIGKGDEVIVPTLTYIASVNAITYTGATPVFVDSLPDTWQMDPEDIKKKITSKTKAIMCVHLYGHPCDMDEIIAIKKTFNLKLIEDCAEALGSKYKNKLVGSFGDISTFSFYGNKTITTGEGGMVVTNNKILHEKAKHFKGQGLAKNREYWHDVVGYNYRMTNICAAIGLAQLEKIDSIIAQKAKIAEWYKKELKNTSFRLQTTSKNVFHTYWMCTILAKDQKERDALRNYLKKNGIETRPVFYPIHTMPMYFKGKYRFKIAETIGNTGINLPSSPTLQYKDIQEISAAIRSFKNS